MKIQIAKIVLLGLVAAALAFTPTLSQAQDATNAPAQTTAPKKHHATPFHGKVAAVDSAAQTLTVGTLALEITSKTKISNAVTGEAAVLSDITVGEYVSGSYTKDSEGNLRARVIHIGKKVKKAAASADAGSATNSVPN
jgi:hypothetical protein